MQTSQTSSTVLPADWTTVLTRIQQEIGRSIATVSERSEATERLIQPSESLGAIERDFLATRERLSDFERFVARADQQVTEADLALHSGEESLRAWLSAIVESREKLSRWTSHTM